MSNESSAHAVPDNLSASEALELLKRGNERFHAAVEANAPISSDLRKELVEKGQAPYAVIICCSDSRVIPEHIFMSGLGELFIIRVAGNIVGNMGLASVIYACEHLGVRLLLLLGHTHCGAVEAAMSIEQGDIIHGAVGTLAERIRSAIGGEQDPDEASKLNVEAGIERVRSHEEIQHLERTIGLEVHGALYHTSEGTVEFL